jgi:predicted MFS family arabinose efflux permease
VHFSAPRREDPLITVSEPTLSTAAFASGPESPNWLAALSLAGGTFVLVTSEFLPPSLLSPMAHDLGVSQGAAGQAVTATAVMGALVAPSIALIAKQMDRRLLMWGLCTLLVISNATACTALNIWMLLVARVLLGVALAGFWSMAASLASRLAPPDSVAGVMSLILSGASIATVCAAPVGAMIGNIWSWRMAFALAGLLGTLALCAQIVCLPKLVPTTPTSMATLVEVSQRPRVRFGLVIVLLIAAGHFAAFTYLRPYLEQVSHYSVERISALFLTFGIAGFVGNILGGIAVNRSLPATVAGAPIMLGLSAIALSMFGLSWPMSVVTVASWGVGFGAVPIGLQTWMARAAPDHLESVGGLFIAMFQFAIAVGSIFGGLLIDHAGARSAVAFGGSSTLAAGALVWRQWKKQISCTHCV